MAANAVVPPPPRLTGDPATDVLAINKWASDFFNSTVVESGLLDPAYQANPGTFDQNNLHDPVNSSIAKSQDTANRAIQALIAAGIPIPD